jgi:hypothetical protein
MSFRITLTNLYLGHIVILFDGENPDLWTIHAEFLCLLSLNWT